LRENPGLFSGLHIQYNKERGSKKAIKKFQIDPLSSPASMHYLVISKYKINAICGELASALISEEITGERGNRISRKYSESRPYKQTNYWPRIPCSRVPQVK
jgi:hypothetical protein